ncbi:MAG: hypothetical protein QOE58_916 [Actinomycetota bacterium]|jgi:hypothetical protein|nr:hypothetical protein [Actinomycetota bacterium]
MLLRTAKRVVLIALGTVLVGMVGALMGFLTLNVTLIVVFRSVLVIALLPVMTRALRIRDNSATDHVGRPDHQVLIAAGLAFFLNLAAWGGHALFGQLLIPVAVLAASLDFVVWMAVAIFGVRLGDRSRVRASLAPAPAPYA